ncbi:toxin-antitoxin system HicB family antitoxin [Streptomyces sp. NPDC093250]|uniref:toxin-antitoxin system HicB family antitoxin n=1 Tax=unclassified Streptomyces TaxID=2593676 RepID=UPI00341233B4
MNHEEVRITLRLPADLHARLVAEAKRARRSLNSEILHRLEVGPGDVSADDQSP